LVKMSKPLRPSLRNSPRVMATVELAAEEPRPAVQTSSARKRYSRTKLLLGLSSSALSYAFLAFVALAGVSPMLARWAEETAGQGYGGFLLFAAVLGAAGAVPALPIDFFSGYVLEHRYGLSTQTVGRWVTERLKALVVGLPIGAIVLTAFFIALQWYGERWWLPMAAVVTLLSVVLARLAPVVILPLFYTLSPLPPGALRERIAALCARGGVAVEGIYTFDMSRNTRKANAAFTGVGRGRRILLGDTLLGAFSDEEIEAVFAHELGHRHHRHVLIGILAGTVTTVVVFRAAAALHAWSSAALGYGSVTELAGLPLLALWLGLLGLVTGPPGNMLSRRHERQADAYAVAQTGNAPAFASALRKLARTNLADPEPHPAVEFLFHSHPSIGRRIRALEAVAR